MRGRCLRRRHRDYFLERKYPSFGNLAPRDISSRAAKEQCDDGRGVGTTGPGPSGQPTVLLAGARLYDPGTPAPLAVMLGADVGTALMAQVLSLNLSWLSPLLIVVGVILCAVAMTLTLAAVYAPIGFMSGTTGRLFTEFAWALAGAGRASRWLTAGALAVIKDLLKTDVYRLAEYINRRDGREIIPQSIIDRPPTADCISGLALSEARPSSAPS